MQEKIKQLSTLLRGGVLPAMATPLHDDGERVRATAVAPLAHFLLDQGVAGLFVGGTTGEGLLLAAAERQRLHEAVVDAVGGRAPVLLHAGANSSSEAVRLAAHAAGLRPAGIVAITPTFYGLGDGALLDHFQAVAAAAPDIPFFVYDIPHMAVNGVSPGLLSRLAAAIPSFAGIKTSRPDAQIVRQHIDAMPEHRLVLAGNERIALGLLALGADGLISGLATAVPEPFVALTRTFRRGDFVAARQHQRVINRLLDQIPGHARIGAIKSVLLERGLAVGPPVPPRPALAAPLWPVMQDLIDNPD